MSELKAHPLMEVGCFLNPLFCGIQFVSYMQTRSEHRSQAEDMARKLFRSQGTEHVTQSGASESTMLLTDDNSANHENGPKVETRIRAQNQPSSRNGS